MIRLIEMPFTKMPDHDCWVVIKYKSGGIGSMSYTVEGGWNTIREEDGTVDTECAMKPEEIHAFTNWYKDVKVGGEEWFDTMAVIMEEADKLRQQYEEDGICDDRCDALDEMRDHLACAMNFAEVFTWSA